MITLCKSLVQLLHELGSVFLFLLTVLQSFFSSQGNFKAIVEQTILVSTRSLATVIFSGVFVGAILVLQIHLILSAYNAEVLLGGFNTSVVIREVGPLIISFLLAGKVGAFTAAELGTMRVTDQIDAIECLGTDPIQYLIIPRFMGIVISNLFLLIIGLMCSIGGSITVASAICNINYLEFFSSVSRFSTIWTLTGGVLKSFIFGTIVAIVSCHKGFYATGGARGVGKAVTQASIYTNFYILIANFVFSSFLEVIEQFENLFFNSVR